MPSKILIVDDQQINRKILSAILKEDYEVYEASGGREALEMLSSDEYGFSAILLDIFMSDMDGYEVLKRIRSDARLSSLPVIMMTGSEDDYSRAGSLLLGANDFVTKPYNPDIIRHCLRNHIAFHETEATVMSLQRDRLTGVFNRDVFFEKAMQMIKAKPEGYYVLSCLDINSFKIINDQYSNEKGDEVLCALANILGDDEAASRGINGRISSDNFVMLRTYEDILSYDDRSGRIGDLLFKATGIRATVSIGRYLVDDKTLSASAMYDRAKIAQLTVKGRFDVHIAMYDESMRTEILREQEIVSEMTTALAAGQFEAWYQPQHNHFTGALIGAEALARWRHPVKGLIPPNSFIPIFEKNGFIYSLDKYIWEQVCMSLRGWLNEGRNPLPVSVNISRYDILRGDLVDVLLSLVKKYDLPLSMLRLEITETSFSGGADFIINAVKTLVENGFTVEIDDFGSGYSSLNTLKDVPAQIIKLDMRFLQSDGDSERGGNIVESVVRMVKWLNMSIIAEGVETLEQANYLRSIGCNYMQGYYFARPMCKKDYETYCRGITKEEHLLSLETVENLDNNRFWDPASMDSLIFNSYVGGACIFEYYNGNMEMLRVTQAFVKMFGDDATNETLLAVKWSEHLDGDSANELRSCIMESASEKTQKTVEPVFIDLPGCPHKTYLRIVVRVIAMLGDRLLVYSTNENITAQREAEVELRGTDEQIRFLNSMAHELLAYPDIDEGIRSVLRALMDYFHGKRAYIFEADDENAEFHETETFSNTYEICAPGVSAEIEKLQNLPVSIIGPWTRAFESQNSYSISDVSHLDDSRSEERDLLLSQNIKSLFVAPLRRDGKTIGMFGIDDPLEKLDQVERFAALGDYIAVMLTRRDLTARINSDALALTDIMNDMPGGFARLRLFKGGFSRTEYANEGFCRMLGMTEDELLKEYESDVMAGVHPNDLPVVNDELNRAMSSNGIMNATYRLRRKDGSYAWVQLFARLSKQDNGDTLSNCYYADLSDAEKRLLSTRELTPVILSAIMSSSPNLDFAKDKDFRYICCSPSFARFAGRESPEEVVGRSDFELFPTDTAEQFRNDDVALFTSGESLVNYTEPIPSDDGIQHYCLTSKHILRDSSGEIIGLYGTARDITDTRSALDRLRLLTDSIPGGIAKYMISPKGIETVYFNDGFCKMLGCDRKRYESLLGTDSLFNRIFPEDLPELKSQIDRLYKDGTPIECVYRNVRVDGNGYLFLKLCGEVAERNGDLCFVNTVLYDVTAEKLAKAQADAVMANVDGGIVTFVLKGDEAQLLFANDKGYALFGITPPESGEAFPEQSGFVLEEDRSLVRDALIEVRDTGIQKHIEYRIKRVDGQIRWLKSSVSLMDYPGMNEKVLLCVSYDTTEREKPQRDLLDNLPGGAGLYELVNSRLNLVYQNKSFWEMVGLGDMSFPETAPMSAVHPDDGPVIMAELFAAIAEKRELHCDIRLRHLTEGYHHVHLAGRVIEIAKDDYLIYTTFTPLDKQSLSYRQIMPRILSTIMESSEDISFVKDAELRYLCCSSAFLKLADVTDEKDVIGKTDAELFPPDMAESFHKKDIELFSGKKHLIDYEMPIHTKDGEIHYCRTSKHLMRDADGEVIGIYGVSYDITKERNALEQLRLVNDSIPGGLATLVLADEKMKINYCNDGFCALFGRTKEDFERLREIPLELIYEPDRSVIMAANKGMVFNDVPSECTFRALQPDGSYKWISYKAAIALRVDDKITINAVLLDVTQQNTMLEQLRMSEEESALAIEHGGNIICRFNVSERTLRMDGSAAELLSLPELIEDVPSTPVNMGIISQETAGAYSAFFEAIINGEKVGGVLFQQRRNDDWLWIEAKSTTVFSDDGKPIKAIISMFDVTERLEKETVYKKWQQSLRDMSPDSHTLYRCNLNSNITYESKEGNLITFDFTGGFMTLNERARQYAIQAVFEADQAGYLAFFNRDTMLASYYTGKRSASFEYREVLPGDKVRWLRLTIDLVESPDSTDVEAFILYEDIDKEKRAQIKAKELSETDPLTGVLNRAAFAAQVDRALLSAEPGKKHALLMLDIDGFKRVNDVFGHGAGDDTLVEIATSLCSSIRAGDLVGRLGGDEFLIFLSGIVNDKAAVNKARQICSLARKAFGLDVKISGSVGIVVAPRDGEDFATLYKKVDSALYHVKGTGKDSVALYTDSMEGEHLKPESEIMEPETNGKRVKKRRMLIVDDSSIDYAMLHEIFENDFVIEKAKDGDTALVRLRHYGSAISVVLLDLMMPGLDGFGVLAAMQETLELRMIPVIIVSGDDSRETCLNAIRKGATDFVTKPIDPDILHLRVMSAVSKGENDRLRAKESVIEEHNQERIRYDAMLENAGIVFIEVNWHSGVFNYYPSISNYLLGTYDARPLWQILLSDMVADTRTVQKMQQLVHNIAESKDESGGTALVQLKTPSKVTHSFRMNVNKLVNDYDLTNKLIITLTDLNYTP